MLFKPKWVRLLPAHLRPEAWAIGALERLRDRFGIAHEAFALRVLSSPSTTRRAQRHCLEQLRGENPQASEKELLRMVLMSRLMAPPVTACTPGGVDAAMQGINSFDDLCYYIIALEDQSPVTADPVGIGKRIDATLAGEEAE